MSKFHIGKKIKEVLDKTHYSVIDFAKDINLTRDGAYKIFAKENIDTAQLKQISKVLNHDFFQYYSSDLSVAKENQNPYGFATKEEVKNLADTVHALIREIEKFRESLTAKPKAKKAKAAKKKKAGKPLKAK